MSSNRAVEVLRKLQETKNKDYGDVMLMSKKDIVSVPTNPSGIASLDVVLSGKIGKAYPRGRIIEIYGSEGSGKTTTALHAISAVQNSGGVAAFIDAEHALDVKYASDIGVDMQNLIIQQPDYGEQALETAMALADNMNAGDLVVIDSVAALTPKKELDGVLTNSDVAVHSIMMSKAMKHISNHVNKNMSTIIFINQERMKPMVMMGSNKTTTGGNALKFYATQRIEVSSVGKIKQGEEVIGNKVRYNVTKNKVFPPFRNTETQIRFGFGVPRELDILNLAMNLKIVTNKSSWYYFDNNSIGNGINDAWEFVVENREIMDKIEKKVAEYYGQ